MPYAYIHYPFENQELFERNFPGHFVAEGLDQTRGWYERCLFITMLKHELCVVVFLTLPIFVVSVCILCIYPSSTFAVWLVYSNCALSC